MQSSTSRGGIPLDAWWTPELVEDRLVLMQRVCAATAGRVGPKLAEQTWWNTMAEMQSTGEQARMLHEGRAQLLEDARRAAEQERNRVRRTFSAREIDQGMQATSWVGKYLRLEMAGVHKAGTVPCLHAWVIAHAFGLKWSRVCRRHGWQRDTARRRAEAGLETIAAGLNRDCVAIL